MDWKSIYQSKRMTVNEAIAMIHNGDKVVTGFACGEPLGIERARALIKICHPKFRPKLALEYRHRFKEDPFPREEIGDYIKEVREEVYKTAVSIIGG